MDSNPQAQASTRPARLKFAKHHLDGPEEAWEKVLWSDETKISSFVCVSLQQRVQTVDFSHRNVPTMEITNLSILCKWENLQHQWCISCLFSPLYKNLTPGSFESSLILSKEGVRGVASKNKEKQ